MAVGVAPVARLVRAQRRRHPPAPMAFWGQVASAPVAPGPGVIATDEVGGRGWPRAEQLREVTLAGAAGAESGHRRAGLRRHVRPGDRIVGDIQTAGQWGGRRQGCPPRAWWSVPVAVHEAALAAGQLTRDCPGGQPTPRKS
jgi:hypothetical protein